MSNEPQLNVVSFNKDAYITIEGKASNNTFYIIRQGIVNVSREAINESENLKPLNEYTHIAFNVSPEDFDAMKARIEESGAVEWSENSTEGDSFYFLDPNGHKLEIHCTDLKARIEYGKRNWGEQTIWFV